MTSREIVYRTLEFNNPERAPRNLWLLPWANNHYPEEVKEIMEAYPGDFDGPPGHNSEDDISSGDPWEVGESTDAWGCTFTNYQKGIIGEVKEPIVTDDSWEDVSKVHIPVEWLTLIQSRLMNFAKRRISSRLLDVVQDRLNNYSLLEEQKIYSLI